MLHSTHNFARLRRTHCAHIGAARSARVCHQPDQLSPTACSETCDVRKFRSCTFVSAYCCNVSESGSENTVICGQLIQRAPVLWKSESLSNGFLSMWTGKKTCPPAALFCIPAQIEGLPASLFSPAVWKQIQVSSTSGGNRLQPILSPHWSAEESSPSPIGRTQIENDSFL